jgi:multiple sugar transport system substrate-binding protein
MPGRRRPGTTGSLLLTVLALLLAGCATGGQGSAAAGGPVHITFWSAVRGSQQVADEFNRTHTTVKVDYEQVPAGDQGGWAKLSNASRAGNAPDVATIEYPQLPGFAIDGVPRSLNGLMPDSLRRAIQPQALDLTTFSGHTYGVPGDIEPMVFMYRKDVFTKYDIPVPKTWAQFESAARKLKKADPGARIASFFPNSALYFAALAWQAGAQWYSTSGNTWHIDLDDAPTRKVAAYWQRLVDEDLVRSEPATSQQWKSHLADGSTVGYTVGAWGAGSIMQSTPDGKGKWAIAPLPQWDTAKPALGAQGGSTYVVTKDSKHPAAAMQFIDWLVSSPAALKARLASGTSSAYPAVPALVPVARKAMDNSYFGGEDIFGLFQQQASLVTTKWKWGPRMTPTLHSIQDEFAKAAAGSGTIDGSLRSGQDQTMPDLTSLGLSVATR